MVPLGSSRVPAGGMLQGQLGVGLVPPPSNRLTKRRSRWFSDQGSWFSVDDTQQSGSAPERCEKGLRSGRAGAGGCGPAARGADAGDDEAVAVGRKPCSRLTASRSLRISSLRNSTTVLHSVQCRWSCDGVAVVVLVGRPVGQPELAEQARLDQEPQGAVDRRPADRVPGVVQVGDQLIGVEMLVRVEDMPNKHPPGLGQLLAPDLQELAELLLGRSETDSGASSSVRRSATRAFPGHRPVHEAGRPGDESLSIMILHCSVLVPQLPGKAIVWEKAVRLTSCSGGNPGRFPPATRGNGDRDRLRSAGLRRA